MGPTQGGGGERPGGELRACIHPRGLRDLSPEALLSHPIGPPLLGASWLEALSL